MVAEFHLRYRGEEQKGVKPKKPMLELLEFDWLAYLVADSDAMKAIEIRRSLDYRTVVKFSLLKYYENYLDG